MKRFAKAVLVLLLALALCVPAWALEMYPDEAVIYEQLSSGAQNVYDVMENHLSNFYSGEPLVLTDFSGTFSTQRECDELQALFMDMVSTAYAAILQNHPEIFWLSGISSSLEGTAYNGRLNCTITVSFSFQNPWGSGARSVNDDAATVKAAAQNLAEEACVQGGPYDQLLYVHDWLTRNNVYNSAAAEAGARSYYDYLPWTPLSALTDESQPVCEGYARAFKLVCDELGYPCIYVSGIGITDDGSQGPHGWNMVQVAGKWYAVDVTFDDPGVSGVTSVVSGHETHAYFMVGEETLIDDYYIFSDSHIPTGAVTNMVSFTYPALNPEALDPGFTWGPGDIDDPDGPDDPEEPEPEYVRFSDVPDTAYYVHAVQWAVGVGVTNGKVWDVENGIFEFWPDATVKRCEAVTFLWRAMGEPEPKTKTNPFSDVPANSYYEKAVLWAVENEITNGKVWDEVNGVYQFAPDDTVTRGQMLTFLWRTVGKPDETEPYAGKQWYSDAEYWADDFGILGDTALYYTTNGECPRSDVVYYLYHAYLTMTE